MNEKLQYASMLEIPVNTCQINTLPHKKRRLTRKKKISDEEVKAQVLKKINSEQELMDKKEENKESIQIEQASQEQVEIISEQEQNSASVHYSENKKHKRQFKLSVVGVQLAIIGTLVLTILLTNVFYADSGINVFLRGVFGGENKVVDLREYDQFKPVISMGDNYDISITDGVISFAGEGSVYAPCDGIVNKITTSQDGKFDIEISHSQNFKSIISDVEHIYVAEGDKVYSKIPLGYLKADGANMCFKNNQDQILDDYQIVDNMVVWLA